MPNPPDILDLNRLRDIYEDDTAGMLELYDMMLKNNAAHLEKLESGVEAHDLEAVRKAAHAIKGSSGNVGANRLSRLAAEVEESARDGSWDGIATKVAEMRPGFESVKAEIEKLRTG